MTLEEFAQAADVPAAVVQAARAAVAAREAAFGPAEIAYGWTDAGEPFVRVGRRDVRAADGAGETPDEDVAAMVDAAARGIDWGWYPPARAEGGDGPAR